MPKASTQQRKALDTYYAAIANYQKQGVTHEQATRLAFSTRLDTLARAQGWTLVLEQQLANRKRPDGTLYTASRIPVGWWEAKDTTDDLDAAIVSKIKAGYPLKNTIFEDTRRAVLYQNGQPIFEADLHDRAQLAALLDQFFKYTNAQIDAFNVAVQEFQVRIPDLAQGLMERIEAARKDNRKFIAAFGAFHDLCRTAIDPDISAGEIETMLVQHLLTERIFRTIFANTDFTARNAIAVEIEKVIRALTSRAFSRQLFLRDLDYFYKAIEDAAQTIDDFAQKQTFLNHIYERFFQGFSRQQADTHGVVYTPQPIVDFMCESVDAILQREFGKSLSDAGVYLLDPCVGTGNFIVNLLRRVHGHDRKRKYEHELFCNEVMLLPYYIASLNIEHAYYELTHEYAPFKGICFADTLDLAKESALPLFGEENTERILREKGAPITVIVGNPPYNVGQRSENENNKNRRYIEGQKSVDNRIRATYAKDSKATNKNALSDPYVKFFRWAADRLEGRDGIVCFVSNNSFVDQLAFDGMRQHLAQDFTAIYHLDLHGNVRKNPKLSGTTHNVFGIQVGVGITVLVRHRQDLTGLRDLSGLIHYYRVPEDWRKEDKYKFLAEAKSIAGIEWQTLKPDAKHTWLTAGMKSEFESFLPMGTKEGKAARAAVEAQVIFKEYGRGVATSRDDWAYDFDASVLAAKMQRMIEFYNHEIDRWRRRRKKFEGSKESALSIDDFVDNDETKIKWSRDLKLDLQRDRYGEFAPEKIRRALYRPFCKKHVFFDRILNEEVYILPSVFPTPASENENTVIIVSDQGHRSGFSALMTNVIPDLHVLAAVDAFQGFPFYVYDEDGRNRRENITDWALVQFQSAYGAHVTKRDIFYCVYAILHHPDYRARYAANLKHELPRIPLLFGHSEARRAKESLPRGVETLRFAQGDSSAFRRLVEIGAQLAQLHLTYEQAPEYPLRWIENKDMSFSWRVARMKLTPDKTAVVVNDSLTLAGLPPECFNYRLGNRSALEWVIDQYQVSTDKRSGITTDPNRADDPEYIVRLVGRVVTVSVETVKLVADLMGPTP